MDSSNYWRYHSHALAALLFFTAPLSARADPTVTSYGAGFGLKTYDGDTRCGHTLCDRELLSIAYATEPTAPAVVFNVGFAVLRDYVGAGLASDSWAPVFSALPLPRAHARLGVAKHHLRAEIGLVAGFSIADARTGTPVGIVQSVFAFPMMPIAAPSAAVGYERARWSTTLAVNPSGIPERDGAISLEGRAGGKRLAVSLAPLLFSTYYETAGAKVGLIYLITKERELAFTGTVVANGRNAGSWLAGVTLRTRSP